MTIERYKGYWNFFFYRKIVKYPCLKFSIRDLPFFLQSKFPGIGDCLGKEVGLPLSTKARERLLVPGQPTVYTHLQVQHSYSIQVTYALQSAAKKSLLFEDRSTPSCLWPFAFCQKLMFRTVLQEPFAPRLPPKGLEVGTAHPADLSLNCDLLICAQTALKTSSPDFGTMVPQILCASWHASSNLTQIWKLRIVRHIQNAEMMNFSNNVLQLRIVQLCSSFSFHKWQIQTKQGSKLKLRCTVLRE